jgi:hypothetical protein
LGADGDSIRTPTDAFHDAANQFAELKEYFSYYLAAKSDGFKTSVRNLGLYAALGIVGLITLSSIIVTACALLIFGIARGFTWLFHGHRALGYTTTGILVLGVIFGGAFLGMSMLTKSSRKRTVEKYEHWKEQQRAKFGTDVERQAENAHR